MAAVARRPSVWKRISGIDRRFCWSFLSFVIGIAGIYYGVFYKRSANLSIDILSNTNIADISQDAGKLDILYDGKSIKTAGDALSVIVVRIVNDGNAPIRIDSFTPADPFGFVIPEGNIIDVPQVTEASTDYLRKTMKAAQKDQHTVTFAPVIMRPGDFVGLRVLAIHGASSNRLAIDPIGTVADVDSITVRHLYDTQQPTSIWWQVIEGGIIVNILRFVLSICVVVAVVLVFTTLDSIASRRQRRLQRMRINGFIAKHRTPKNAEIMDQMVNRFQAGGSYDTRMTLEEMDRITAGKRPSRYKKGLVAGLTSRTTDPTTGKAKVEVLPEARQLYEDFAAFIGMY
jgi:hypothetical protein